MSTEPLILKSIIALMAVVFIGLVTALLLRSGNKRTYASRTRREKEKPEAEDETSFMVGTFHTMIKDLKEKEEQLAQFAG